MVALADGGAEGRPLGQHAGERAARWRRWSRTTASTRATMPDFTRGRDARRPRSSRASSSRAHAPTATAKDVPMAQLLATAPAGHDAAADVHARGHRHALLHGAACATRPISCSRTGSTAASASSAATRRTSRTATRPAATTLQGRRSGPRHADARPDEGAALRRGHRSAARRLRAGRVVVRDDGGDARRSEQDDRATATATGRRGGSAAASITSSATTTGCSSSRRA